MGFVRSVFHEDFDDGLSDEFWLPSYLLHWSSRRSAAASWTVDDSALVLSIPPEQGVWCQETHTPPLRVSGVQSALFSGPVGTTVGQQPFADGLLVREEQPLWIGWTWHGGLLEVRARMDLSSRSMASVWAVGVEDEPVRCGEICVFEVFGDSVDGASAAVGQGVHPFRDASLTDDFEAVRVPIDVTRWHTYAAHWQDDRIEFFVDGAPTRVVQQTPRYSLQLMVAVFDFPDRARPGDEPHVPRLWVDTVDVRGAAQA